MDLKMAFELESELHVVDIDLKKTPPAKYFAYEKPEPQPQGFKGEGWSARRLPQLRLIPYTRS